MPHDVQSNTNLVPQYLQSVTPVTSVHTRSAARGALYICTANLNYFTRSFKNEVLDYGII